MKRRRKRTFTDKFLTCLICSGNEKLSVDTTAIIDGDYVAVCGCGFSTMVEVNIYEDYLESIKIG